MSHPSYFQANPQSPQTPVFRRKRHSGACCDLNEELTHVTSVIRCLVALACKLDTFSADCVWLKQFSRQINLFPLN